MKSKRIAEIGAMTTQVAVKELENLTLKLFLSKEKMQERERETQSQIAEIVFAKLSQLKGTGLKLLQALSLDEELLPKPYIEKFESAYTQVSPLSRPIVKKVFKSETGESPEDAFASFDYQAFAAASLGQVHRATLKTGENVVVKVQYPNVAENMQSDLQFIKAIAKTIGNPLIRSSVEELSRSLIAETDYKMEAENLKGFEGISMFGPFELPKVIDEFSSKRIITLSELGGEPLHSVKDQALRNQALQRVFDFFFVSLVTKNSIHADPHPGNFLVKPNVLGVVDFGSVKKDIPKDVVELFMLLLDSHAEASRIAQCYAELGAKIGEVPQQFYDKYVKEFHMICSQLIGKENVNFAEMRPLVSKMRRNLFIQSREQDLQGLSSEFTLLHKAFQSLLFMLCKYKATIDTRVEK